MEENIILLRTGKGMETERGFYAPASISVIKSNSSYSLIDAGCFGEERQIRNLLKSKEILLEDIKNAFITHNHPDHIGTISMFRNAKIHMPDSIFNVSEPNYFKLMPEDFYIKPGKSLDVNLEGILILSTPGHAGWDFSIFYTGKEKRVLIVGDLFWSQDDWEKDSEFLSLCINPEMQKRSREYVREKLKPDVVIPGHGSSFEPKY